MPTIFDTTIAEFLEPIHSHKNKSLKIIMRKQLHICNSRCQQRTKLMATTAIMDFFLSRTLKKEQHVQLRNKNLGVLQTKARR